MENIEVERRLQAAISALRSQDSHLLEVDASERSITHRLAVHLERLFPGWDVDCEYNRDRRDHKTINLGMAGIRAARRTGKVYPDIIVHHRGSKNLLAVELKKRGGVAADEDYKRSEAYVHQLGYEQAWAI